jgi:type IV pilus assembly protein PilO
MVDGEPPSRQKLILGVILIAGLGYLGYNYLYSPRSAEIGEIEARLTTLEAQNTAARTLTRAEGRSNVERQLALYRDQLDRVEGLIPSSEELPDLLDAISAEAQRTGVDLSLIQPVGATAEAFYTRRTYDLAVLGTFHEIGAFLTEIGSLPRIVTPIDLQVTVQGDDEAAVEPTLEARFSIETYVLPSSAVAADTDSNDAD